MTADDDLDDFDSPSESKSLVHIYARGISRQNTRFRWCPHWYLHPEALARLEALWKASEHLHQC